MALTPTKRARGANARVITAFETTVGVPPAANGGWTLTPIVSHSLGEERPLIESNLLGQGREMQDPTPDVATNDGDIVVPVDARNFGKWLRLFFGDAVKSGDAEAGFTHVFTSGAQALPSMSVEIGSPEVPAFSTHRGARGNQLRIAMSRSGLLDATCSLICIGETPIVGGTAGPASPQGLDTARFPQATGFVRKGGQPLGSVLAATLTYSNNLEKVETIQPDGRIEDSDPGMAQSSGAITLKFADLAMLNAATNGDAVDLEFGWAIGAFSLSFVVPRVFLPRPKKPITGPAGIQIELNWQSAKGGGGFAMQATLKNDVASY